MDLGNIRILRFLYHRYLDFYAVFIHEMPTNFKQIQNCCFVAPRYSRLKIGRELQYSHQRELDLAFK